MVRLNEGPVTDGAFVLPIRLAILCCQTFRMSVRLPLSFACLSVAVILSGCGSSSAPSGTVTSVVESAPAAADVPLATDAPVSEPPASEVPVTEPPATEAPVTEVAIAETVAPVSEPASGSPVSISKENEKTCEAVARVKTVNDSSEDLLAGMSVAVSAATDPAQVEEAFGEFLTEFSKRSEVIIPELKSAYNDLGAEQPQFKEDLDLLASVTDRIFAKIKTMKGSDLDNFQNLLVEAVPAEELQEAGEATLRIDKFSLATCGIKFANT